MPISQEHKSVMYREVLYADFAGAQIGYCTLLDDWILLNVFGLGNLSLVCPGYGQLGATVGDEFCSYLNCD